MKWMICLCALMIVSASSWVSAEVTLETHAVAMRDGVKLATDVYRDQGVTKAPVILIRTPYDRTRQKPTAERYAQAGYVLVVQDCRGTRASEGVLAPYNNEGQDGYDTIEWINHQDWSNGRVGMMGGSYVGAVQWQAAVEQPPGLVTIAPQATWSSFYRNLYLGGAVRLSLIASWLAGNAPKPEGAVAGDFDQAFMKLPLSEVDQAIGWSMPWLDAYLTHPEPNGFWTRVDLTRQLPEVNLPVLHVVGYYDFFSRESVDNFVIMQQQNRDPQTAKDQQLVLGPWDHGTIGKSKVAEVDFGPDAALDINDLQLDWFARHLKRDASALAKRPAAVKYFSMGDNRWQTADTWPPAGFKQTAFYLHSDGHANTRKGSGQVNQNAPRSDEPSDSFRADPAKPVPACPVTDKRPLKAAEWGPIDQSSLEDRSDMLVYNSGPLDKAITLAGNVSAKLYVSADTPDADWVVKLVDVRPDGFAQNLATGILRGRYRNSLLKPELMKTGETYELTIDMGPCAAVIAAGHQLRIDVCGALFPLYDRNPNTAEGIFGSHTAIATESVHHRPNSASCVMLPVKD